METRQVSKDGNQFLTVNEDNTEEKLDINKSTNMVEDFNSPFLS